MNDSKRSQEMKAFLHKKRNGTRNKGKKEIDEEVSLE